MFLSPSSPPTLTAPVRAYALMWAEVAMNDRISRLGASLVSPGERILTVCNTGALATPGGGTALGAIKCAHELHREKGGVKVWVCETRPLLQGGRLTTYELEVCIDWYEEREREKQEKKEIREKCIPNNSIPYP